MLDNPQFGCSKLFPEPLKDLLIFLRSSIYLGIVVATVKFLIRLNLGSFSKPSGIKSSDNPVSYIFAADPIVFKGSSLRLGGVTTFGFAGVGDGIFLLGTVFEEFWVT